ncbi:MAG: helix-turn-helix domain-containing protein [Flavobacteriaceae bacterium]|jgi:transcriptional regulator with XRE-family HTH domain|tara:strand:- start:265 stop:558 length:294 start_codon:yes stop_codon:yes gene_type:complete
MNMVKRLEQFIKSKKISKSAFANEIGVQRSSIAHFFSGRNKPSLDFYIKIKEKYPEVDLNWIISGVKSKKGKTNTKEKNDEIESIIILFKDGSYQKR